VNAGPRPEHPRPDRRRDRWSSLNGTWQCSFGGEAPDQAAFDRRIEVPFAFQCAASGIGSTDPHEVIWYRRTFVSPARGRNERVLLHFGAVDFEARVWVDDVEVGGHRGGHTSFTIDITDALAAADETSGSSEHVLVVQAIDRFRPDQLRGKQTATFPYMIHYTPTSGIWQPVWLEVTGSAWIDELQVVAGHDGRLEATAQVGGAGAHGLRLTIEVDGSSVEMVSHDDTAVAGEVAGATTWSPDEPNLHALRADLLDANGDVVDTVHGHVGFRTVSIDGDEWLLNGEPLRQRLLLDQGYWPESLITSPSDDALLADLLLVKEMGFNGVRKHQKVEDPRFLWHADRLGLLVWEELPSPFGLARLEGRLLEDASAEWGEAIRRDRSHPCIVAWVPVNESWGVQGVFRRAEHQATLRRLVAETKALDPTRPVVDNSGWGHVETDVVDVHDYDQDPTTLAARWAGIEERGWERGRMDLADESSSFDLARWLEFVQVDPSDPPDRRLLAEMLPDVRVWADGCAPARGEAGPLVLSEFGGVGLPCGAGPTTDRYDYAGAADPDDLLARFEALVVAAESVPEMRGWCWTQLTDTEQEINGLLAADRTPKVDPARVRAALDAAPWGRASDTSAR
jgi:beta-galactosidase/beta-glucuronidase